MRNPDFNLLVRIAMADAYGMGAEYLKPEDAPVLQEVLKFERYVRHPRHSSGAGKYTDDTEMSIANARVLLDHKPPYSRLDFANMYVNEFAYGGRRKGYSQGFQAVLERVRSGEELLATVKADSEKNGAAMRAVPFGVIPEISLALDATTVSAEVTHATNVGRFSARAITTAAHFAMHSDRPLSEIRSYVHLYAYEPDKLAFADALRRPWAGDPVVGGHFGPVGITTVMAVLTLVESETSLIGILRKACEWGGDVDSVAAIAWGIASPRYPRERLPDFFERDLEFGSPRTGRERLRDVWGAVMDRFA